MKIFRLLFLKKNKKNKQQLYKKQEFIASVKNAKQQLKSKLFYFFVEIT